METIGKGGILDRAAPVLEALQEESKRVEVALNEIALNEIAPVEPEMPEEDSHPVFDASPLEELRMLEELGDFSLQDTVDTALADVTQRLERARAALAENDIDTLRREAHTIKSSARDLGGLKLAETCQRFEDLGQGGDSEGASDLLDQMASESQVFRASLIAYVDG